MERQESIPSLSEEAEETYRFYLHDLNLSPEDLENKRILDVGSADSLFEKVIKAKNPEAHVFSVDINPYPDTVQGSWYNLPFKDESFDLVLSRGTIAHSIGENLAAIKEMIRIAQKGGKIRFGVVTKGTAGAEERRKLESKDFAKFMEFVSELERQGKVRTREIPIGEWVVEQNEDGFPAATEEGYCYEIERIM